MEDLSVFSEQLKSIVRAGLVQQSTIKPSEWAEEKMKMGKPRPGPLRYSYTPYTREWADFFDPYNHFRNGAVIKGSQIGGSASALYPACGWTIEINPGNMYFMVGAAELVEKGMKKLDKMIDVTGIRHLIKADAERKRNQRTGDTNTMKEFPLGYIYMTSPGNLKSIAQETLDKVILDDADAMKAGSADAGSLEDLLEQRFAASQNTYKYLRISTPLLKSTSIIEPAFLKGNRRYWFVECPCCHDPIIFRWETPEGHLISELTGEKALCKGGFVWERNNHGQVIEKSVGYICYRCGGWFNDKNKQQLLQDGMYKSTAIPISEDWVSWKVPSLYAPIGMFGWYHYVKKWVEIQPDPLQPKNERKMQVFMNTCLAETYEQVNESLNARQITGNQRDYLPFSVPERLSIADGCGRIVMLTLGADINGRMSGINGATEDDARLDWQIIAHTEHGQTYSIAHGSIGTFIYNEKNQPGGIQNREKWTYAFDKPNSVWPEFDNLLDRAYYLDDGESWMKIFFATLDCGYLDSYAHAYLDRTNFRVVGVRGSSDETYQKSIKQGMNVSLFEQGKARRDVYFLKVGLLKDDIAYQMKLKWPGPGSVQPPGFLNYPKSDNGMYQMDNFFSHYEQEKRTEVKDRDGNISFRWVKVSTGAQNHMYDCHIYNMAAREILVEEMRKENKNIKPFGWTEFAYIMLGGAV